MTDRLDLSPKHRAILEEIIVKHLPDIDVWAYGSRVNGQSHESSDLDLVLRGPGLKEIQFDVLRNFKAAVRECSIPILVEARDWARIPERFQREIERGYIVLAGSRRSAVGDDMQTAESISES